MSRNRIAAIVLLIGLAAPVAAFAQLEVLGTDTLGRQLIYDADLDITWYDFTSPIRPWATQVTWLEELSVTFGDSVYTDWRLPHTIDGPYNPRTYTGDGYAGFNITTSELGHLYYAELGNGGTYLNDPDGILSGCGLTQSEPSCLTNEGPFLLLSDAYSYWSEDMASISWAKWFFQFYTGHQYFTNQGDSLPVLPVRDGRAVAAGSVPTTKTSFGYLKALYR